MNSSLFTADRMTHVKVVVVSLVASIMVLGVAITAHTNRVDTGIRILADGPAVKAQKLINVTTSDQTAVR
jgi:hypothetical protein